MTLWTWSWNSSEMSGLFGYVNSGQKDLAVWCGFVPLKGDLQPHSRSGKSLAIYPCHDHPHPFPH